MSLLISAAAYLGLNKEMRNINARLDQNGQIVFRNLPERLPRAVCLSGLDDEPTVDPNPDLAV